MEVQKTSKGKDSVDQDKTSGQDYENGCIGSDLEVRPFKRTVC